VGGWLWTKAVSGSEEAEASWLDEDWEGSGVWASQPEWEDEDDDSGVGKRREEDDEEAPSAFELGRLRAGGRRPSADRLVVGESWGMAGECDAKKLEVGVGGLDEGLDERLPGHEAYWGSIEAKATSGARPRRSTRTLTGRPSRVAASRRVPCVNSASGAGGVAMSKTKSRVGLSANMIPAGVGSGVSSCWV